jgi:quinol monooxygenase YgiN
MDHATEADIAINHPLRKSGARLSFHPAPRNSGNGCRPDKAHRREMMMVVVQGQAKFAPGVIDTYIDALTAQMVASNAEEGCHIYAFSRDIIDPDTLHITETWRDQAALDAHMASAHMATFNAAVAEAKPLSLTVSFFETAGPRGPRP